MSVVCVCLNMLKERLRLANHDTDRSLKQRYVILHQIYTFHEYITCQLSLVLLLKISQVLIAQFINRSRFQDGTTVMYITSISVRNVLLYRLTIHSYFMHAWDSLQFITSPPKHPPGTRMEVAYLWGLHVVCKKLDHASL